MTKHTNIKTLKAPLTALMGEVHIPGDKSVSHRSIMLSAIADGTTEIHGLLESEDVKATIKAFQKMGVEIYKKGTNWFVNGVGLHGLKKPASTLNFGNSGTTARLMMGILAGQNFICTIDGDQSLRKRPMKRVTEPLSKMGAKFTFLEKDGCLPIKIKGKSKLKAFENFQLPVASAQIKSAVMLATLYAEYEKGTPPSRIIENSVSRNHTENMLHSFGGRVYIPDKKLFLLADAFMPGKIKATHHSYIAGGRRLRSPSVISIPADPSSAAFFIAAALMVPNSKITLPHVGINHTRTGFIRVCRDILKLNVSASKKINKLGEDTADITVQYSKPAGKKDYVIPASYAPAMIDEYPILSVLAASMNGSVTMEGIEELRHKESDRIKAMEAGLKACGIKTTSGDDWLKVYGTGFVAGGGRITTHLDHRIAMSFIMLGLIAKKPITIDDVSHIATSFPNFFNALQNIGVDYQKA